MHLFIYLLIKLHIFIWMYVYIHIHIYIYRYMYMWIYIIYIYMNITHMYMHIPMYTSTYPIDSIVYVMCMRQSPLMDIGGFLPWPQRFWSVFFVLCPSLTHADTHKQAQTLTHTQTQKQTLSDMPTFKQKVFFIAQEQQKILQQNVLYVCKYKDVYMHIHIHTNEHKNIHTHTHTLRHAHTPHTPVARVLGKSLRFGLVS